MLSKRKVFLEKNHEILLHQTTRHHRLRCCLSGHHFQTVRPVHLHHQTGADKQGTNAYGLVKAAEQLGFTAKGVKGNQEAFFSQFPLPAIAHVVVDGTLLHYVVIHKITKDQVILADPAKGIVKQNPEDFFKIWTGVLILLVPSQTFPKGKETKKYL